MIFYEVRQLRKSTECERVWSIWESRTIDDGNTHWLALDLAICRSLHHNDGRPVHTWGWPFLGCRNFYTIVDAVEGQILGSPIARVALSLARTSSLHVSTVLTGVRNWSNELTAKGSTSSFAWRTRDKWIGMSKLYATAKEKARLCVYIQRSFCFFGRFPISFICSMRHGIYI